MNINFIGPINSLGYGRVGTEICLEGMKEHKIALFPIGNVECSRKNGEAIQSLIKNAEEYSVVAPCIRLWHQFDMNMFVGKGTHIGWPIFEMNRFTRQEEQTLRRCDKLFVCSKWAAGICAKYGLPAEVIPLGYNPTHFFPIKPNFVRKDKIRFLNMGKWELRKGHDILVNIFNAAFNENDDVELLMCNHNPFFTDEQNKYYVNKYKTSKLGAKIKIIPRLSSDFEINELMNYVDCGIFPSRAEGWNLEACEMMGCGKPVIMTNYAGQSEFLIKEYGIPVKSMSVANDGIWFKGQGDWAEPDFDAAVELMRKFYKSPYVISPPDLTWKKSIEAIECNI